MSRTPYLAAIAVAALLVAVALVYAHGHQQTLAPSSQVKLDPPSISGPVPDLAATDLAGRRVSLRADRGRPLLINFFAWWCHPCKQEAPALATIGRRFGSRVDMIGVSTATSRSRTEAYMRTYGWTWPVVIDSNLTWTDAFDIDGQPWTFLVDRQGRIVWKHPGAISAPAVSRALQRLLSA